MIIKRRLLCIILVMLLTIGGLGVGCRKNSAVQTKNSELFSTTKLILTNEDLLASIADDPGLLPSANVSTFFPVLNPESNGFTILWSTEKAVYRSEADSEGKIISTSPVDGFTEKPSGVVRCSQNRLCVLTSAFDKSSLRNKVYYHLVDESGAMGVSGEITELNDSMILGIASDSTANVFILVDGEMVILKIDTGMCEIKPFDTTLILDIEYVSENRFLLLRAYDDRRVLSEYSLGSTKSEEIASFQIDGEFVPESVSVSGKSPDEQILLISRDGIAEYDVATKTVTTMLRSTTNKLRLYPEDGFLAMSNDRFIVSGEYEFASGGISGLMEVVLSSQEQQKQIIRLAAVASDSSSDVEALAYLFNQSNPNYQIEVEYYGSFVEAYETNKTETLLSAREDMVFDVLGDSPPDIFFLPVGELEVLAVRDVLMDIKPVIDRVIDEHGSEYMTNVLEASRIDGKQFYLTPFFTVSGFMVSEEHIDSIKSFTLERCLEYAQQQEISLFSSRFVFEWVPAFDAAFIDRKAGETFFDSPECIRLIEQLKEGIESSAGTPLMRFATFSNFSDYLFDMRMRASDFSFIGYPQGTKDPPRISASMAYGIYGKSAQTEGAVKFLDFILSSTIQNMSVEIGRDEMPVLISAMDAQIRSMSPLAIKENGDSIDIVGGIEESDYVRDYPLDQTWETAFREVIISARGFYITDFYVQLIFEEEIKPFVEGERTAEDVAKILQSRIGLYIAERQ